MPHFPEFSPKTAAVCTQFLSRRCLNPGIIAYKMRYIPEITVCEAQAAHFGPAFAPRRHFFGGTQKLMTGRQYKEIPEDKNGKYSLRNFFEFARDQMGNGRKFLRTKTSVCGGSGPSGKPKSPSSRSEKCIHLSHCIVRNCEMYTTCIHLSRPKCRNQDEICRISQASVVLS